MGNMFRVMENEKPKPNFLKTIWTGFKVSSWPMKLCGLMPFLVIAWGLSTFYAAKQADGQIPTHGEQIPFYAISGVSILVLLIIFIGFILEEKRKDKQKKS